MDRPLPLDPERRTTTGGGVVALRVLEITKWPVDGAETVSAAGNNHPRERRMPLVSRVVGVESADADGARPAARGIVGDAEVHGLEPAARLGDCLDVGHAERCLDQ